MTTRAEKPAHAVPQRRRRRAGHNPLLAPLALLAAVVIAAGVYVAYVLWPRWPDTLVAPDAPSLPIMVAGVTFNIEPAAIRVPVQRRTGNQERVDLQYLWPSLKPPEPATGSSAGAPIDPNERLFVTIQAADGTLAPIERLQKIYSRYLAAAPEAVSDGLTLRRFRDGTPYQGEELIIETQMPAHFLARCSLSGVGNSGACLLERRIGEADITVRFPRDWLPKWHKVAKNVDQLLARLHPG